MSSGGLIQLLQFAPLFCGNPISGAALRNYHLGAALSKRMPVTHIGFAPPDAPSAPREEDPRRRFVSVPRESSYRFADLLRGVLGPVPFSVLNYTRAEMKRVLADMLEQRRFDIVQLEGVQLGGYLPLLRAARPRAIVCDWHNIESEVLYRYAEAANSPARRVYARRAGAALERYERRFIHDCDLHITVSERDRDALLRYGARSPVIVIENGVDVAKFSRLAATSRRFRIVFVGAMDYHANEDAALHFARGAWPEIHRALPEAVFTIVGRKPGPELRALASAPGIEVTGTVADVGPYYSEALISVAPLRVAGGTRLKILEAMAAGVPVVASAVGAEGLAAVDGTHYLRADTAEEMRDSVLTLARDGSRAAELSSAGRELVRSRYDWETLGEALAERLLALAGA